MITRIIEWVKSLTNRYIDPIRFRYDEPIRYWDSNSKLHRSNGPAVDFNDGDWVWRLHGKQHRYYGPSDRFSKKYYWFVHGRYIK